MGGAPIGEIWFEAPGDPELLVKYLFTSEALSVQCHPGDAAARAMGLPRGKDECWFVLAAEPGAAIAMGPRAPMTADEIREAALDGSIVDKLEWKSVATGDFLQAHAGVIHAIGAGITLIEIQQHCDTTYRLYDYGRPRALHLAEGIAIAERVPYVPRTAPRALAPGRDVLAEGPSFVVERWRGGERRIALDAGVQGWVVPISGTGRLGEARFGPGQCLLVEGDETLIASADADLLFAYPGARRMR